MKIKIEKNLETQILYLYFWKMPVFWPKPCFHVTLMLGHSIKGQTAHIMLFHVTLMLGHSIKGQTAHTIIV